MAKYRRKESAARAFELAWTHAELQFRFLQIGPAAALSYQELAGRLLYLNARMRPSPGRLALNGLGQSALWAYGISGDLPMVTVTIAESFNLSLIRELLAGAHLLAFAGLPRGPDHLESGTPQL